MKIFKVLIILLISSCSYYGVVNDEGEKVTNIQEIMQEQENEIVVEQIVEEQVSETIENVVVEKKEESKEIIQEENAEVKKEKTKVTTNQTPKTQTTAKKVEQEEKKVEKVVESKTEETTKQEEIQENAVQENVVQEKKVEEKQEEKVVTNAEKCATGNHGMSVGNSGKWFKTKDEAIATYRAEINKWGNMWTNDEISNEEYYANCPYGYEIWTCPYCDLWTLNYYYDK